MAIQQVGLAGNHTDNLGLLDASSTANVSDDGLELGAETEPREPPCARPVPSDNPCVPRLAALIANTALEKVNPGRRMDVAVFLGVFPRQRTFVGGAWGCCM